MAKSQSRIGSSSTRNVTTQGRSRYTQGGVTDKYSTRAGWWERRLMERRDDDMVYVVRAGEQFRPDLIAHRVYGSVNLTWLVLQYNNIVDINTEIVTGAILRLPSQRRVGLEILTQPTGGKKV